MGLLFCRKVSKDLLGAAIAVDLRAAGIGFTGVGWGVGVFRVEAALDYGLAFLEVCLGCDGVVDLFVG